MIKDLIQSLQGNFKEKTRNPFLGTYALVWLVRNWELVFTFFYFDSTNTRQQKIDILKGYLAGSNIFIDLLVNILWTFLVLLVTYILMALSRYIVHFYNKKILPEIEKATDHKSVVTKEYAQQIINQKNRFERLYEEESKLRIEVSEKLSASEDWKFKHEELVQKMAIEVSSNESGKKKIENLEADIAVLRKSNDGWRVKSEQMSDRLDRSYKELRNLRSKSGTTKISRSSRQMYHRLLTDREDSLKYIKNKGIGGVVAAIKDFGLKDWFLKEFETDTYDIIVNGFENKSVPTLFIRNSALFDIEDENGSLGFRINEYGINVLTYLQEESKNNDNVNSGDSGPI